jgi:hypothetical protein
MTVRHIVMWNVRGQRGTAAHRHNMQKLKHVFEGLDGQIPGLLKIEIGLDFSAVDYACDVVLYSEFDDVASLRAYQQHPAHLAARDQVGDIRSARFQVDYLHE